MDTQQIIRKVKETILKNGNLFLPLLLVEHRDKSISSYPVDFMKRKHTTEVYQQRVFYMGRECGIEHPSNPVVSVAFIAEASIEVTKEGSGPTPFDELNGKDILTISYFDVRIMRGRSRDKMTSTHTNVEIARNESGAIIDLICIPKLSGLEAYDIFLQYFVAGTATASISDAELAEKFTEQG